MSEFETRLKKAVEESVIKMVSAGDAIKPDYGDRIKLPASFMQEIWAMVDTAKIQKQMASRIEGELANRIVNRMAEELSTDIKQILSVKERREALRAVARENMDRICGAAPAVG